MNTREKLQNVAFAFLIALLVAIAVYLAFAFIAFDFNPNNWGQDSRLMCVLFTFLGLVAANVWVHGG